MQVNLRDWTKKIRISGALYLFGGVMALALIAAVAIGARTASQIQVGGPIYAEIMQGQRLIEEISSSAAHIIEAYLEMTLVYNRSRTVEDSKDKLIGLQRQYEERHAVWENADLPEDIKQKVIVESHERVTNFWNAVVVDLLPAMEQDDFVKTANAYREAIQAYQQYRTLLGEIIVAANAMNASIEEHAAAQSRSATIWMAAIVALLFVVLAAGIVIMNRAVVRPLVRLTGAITSLAAGDLRTEIPSTGRTDEVGEIAKAIVVFRDAGVEKERLESMTADQRKAAEAERTQNAAAQARAAEEQATVVRALTEGLERLAQGDLTYRIETPVAEQYEGLKQNFNDTIGHLRQTIGAIVLSTREVASTAAEISTSTTDLSQRTEQQAASLEETSASMEEISATVKKNAESAQEANRFAISTREVANQGGAIVGDAVNSMARIEESSKKISDIIGVIDEIAFQTNLLALNAAVEAARAGEAGRGFAVVAAEVRSLAQRSSQAAKDIKELINNSSGQVQEGVELVNRAGTALNEIVGSIKKVADIVSDIASASAEQATGIDQINTALSQMDEVTQQNSALVEENAASAKSLEELAQGMQSRVSEFSVGDDKTPARREPAAPAAQAATKAKPQAVEPKRAPARANGHGPVARMQAAVATAFKEETDWKEF